MREFEFFKKSVETGSYLGKRVQGVAKMGEKGQLYGDE